MGNGIKTKKHYNISNIVFALRNIWKWDRVFYTFLIATIPVKIVVSVVIVYFPKIIVDNIENGISNEKNTVIIIIYFLLLMLSEICEGFCFSRISMRQYNISTIYQHKINEKFMCTDYANTDNPEENIKYQNAMNDACSGNCAPEVVLQVLYELVLSFLGIFSYGTIIISISPWLLLVIFISAIITYRINRWQRNYVESNRNKWVKIDHMITYLASLSKKFDYAKDIRIYGMLPWLNDMHKAAHAERFLWVQKVTLRSFVGKCISAVMTLLRDGMAYTILITLMLSNKISIGDFVFYFGIITGFSSWLSGLSEKLNKIVHIGIKIGYYREYFEIEEKFNHDKGVILPKKEEGPVEIEFLNVSYKYKSKNEEKYALKNINLKIRSGEKLGIVGVNGAGKTTFVKLLCGFYYPTEGEIKLNGHRISEYNIDEYYTLFSAVFQDIYMLPVTIAEFIASSDQEINRERIFDAIRKAGLEEKIKSLPKGIDSKLMKGVFDDSIDLSGGEKQKLMLARAIYKESPVIVLDEPTASLDAIAENELYLKYNELTENRTAVYISHRLASTRFCDRIIYVENGEILECGSHEELLKLGGKYAYMYEMQSKYYKGGKEHE